MYFSERNGGIFRALRRQRAHARGDVRSDLQELRAQKIASWPKLKTALRFNALAEMSERGHMSAGDSPQMAIIDSFRQVSKHAHGVNMSCYSSLLLGTALTVVYTYAHRLAFRWRFGAV